MIIGAVLLLAALSLFAYNRWDAWRAGQAVAKAQDELKAVEEEIQNSHTVFNVPAEDDADEDVMPGIVIGEYDYIGTLSISRFGLELPVIGEWSYPALRIAPARYMGSVRTGDLVICGHNYDRHFGRLKDLNPGDPIIFSDVLGDIFEYEVDEVLILQPTAVEQMITGDWDLTLFTCTLGGQARVTVRCRLREER